MELQKESMADLKIYERKRQLEMEKMQWMNNGKEKEILKKLRTEKNYQGQEKRK